MKSITLLIYIVLAFNLINCKSLKEADIIYAIDIGSAEAYTSKDGVKYQKVYNNENNNN